MLFWNLGLHGGGVATLCITMDIATSGTNFRRGGESQSATSPKFGIGSSPAEVVPLLWQLTIRVLCVLSSDVLMAYNRRTCITPYCTCTQWESTLHAAPWKPIPTPFITRARRLPTHLLRKKDVHSGLHNTTPQQRHQGYNLWTVL